MTPPWRLREPDPEAVRRLVSEGQTELVATLLVARGITDREGAARHLEASPMSLHDPGLLPGMEAASERIARAITDGERILVHGDYDVDGVTGTALLMRLFRELGGKADWHIPNRLIDGYSFGPHSIERAEAVGAKVVVSVDNGTSEHAVIGELAARGIDTVVTDHHEPKPGPLPEAVAIVNPKLEGSAYPWRELCGAAVAFKLAWGVCQRVSRTPRVPAHLKRFLEEATSYVAIATVCDVVPLVDENRVFARYGLAALGRSKSPGLRALLDVAGLEGTRTSAEDVAFQIGPRLNASGRLGDAAVAVELLLETDEGRARQLARRLDELNQERRSIEAEVLEQARASARALGGAEENPVVVVAGEGWHSGVVGIVAARLTEDLGRPAIVIGLEDGLGRGSARTVPGFDVLAAIAAGDPWLERWGGHRQAAGLEVRADNVDAVRRAVCQRARELVGEEDVREAELWIDHELAFEGMNVDAMRHLDRLGPFGERNEKPVLLSKDVRLAHDPRAVGADGKHLALRLRRGSHALRAMAFGQGERLGELAVGAPMDAVYTPRWNTFRGETNLELELHDFRCGARGAATAAPRASTGLFPA